jgi:hypothetical protein
MSGGDNSNGGIIILMMTMIIIMIITGTLEGLSGTKLGGHGCMKCDAPMQ